MLVPRSLKQFTTSLIGKKRSRKRAAFFRRALTLFSFTVFFLLTLSLHLFAAPPGSKYTAGETLDPSCAPGATNCAVLSGVTVGDAITSATAGSVFFGGAAGILAQDNANLFWDDTNDRLGIGTTTPVDALHIDGFIRTETQGWATAHQTGTRDVQTMLEYNGYFYVGLGDLSEQGNIISYDGTTWATSYDGSQEQTYNLIVFNGLLYAGQGNDAGDGDILVCDPSTGGDADYCDSGDWSTSYDGAQEAFRGFAVYDGKLYAGQGTSAGDADLYVCDPATTGDALACESGDWSLVHDFGSGYQRIEANSMKSYNGKLYVGTAGTAGSADIWVYDGDTWTLSRDGTENTSYAMEIYNGKLYSGTGGGTGTIYVFDGETWTLTYDSPSSYVQSMAVYNGKLFASGQGQYMYVYDGNSWQISSGVGASGESESLGVYNGKLYGVNQSTNSTGGTILVYSERLESQLAKDTTRSLTPFNEQYQNFTKRISVTTDIASSYAATFQNDGNDANRSGLLVQAGLDDGSAAGPSTLVSFADGDGTAIGSITFGSSATAYNTSSDVRLKENITDTTLSLNLLNQIKIRDYTWKADTTHALSHGVIAQELYEVYPGAITKPLDDAGFWMVDYSKLTPLVIKAIQDLSLTVEGIQELEDETFLGKIRAWLASAGNGIAEFVAGVVKAERVETNRLRVQEICIDDETCLTEEQLRQLLSDYGANASAPEPAPEEPLTEAPPEEQAPTDEEPPEEIPAEEPAEEPVVEAPTEEPTEPAVEEEPVAEEAPAEEMPVEEEPVEEPVVEEVVVTETIQTGE